MNTLSTEMIRDPTTLASLVSDWWALWHRTPQATPFQSPAWLMAWWNTFEPGQLCSIAIRSGPRLVALAPLYLDGVRLLPLGIGTSDYCDLLIDPAFERVSAGAVMAAIMGITAWNVCEFPELTADASFFKLPAPAALKTMLLQANAAPVLDLPGRLEDLAEKIPRFRLRQIRRARKAAAKRGDVAVVVGDLQNSNALFQDLIRLHTARWNQRGKTGVFFDERAVAFHATALPALITAKVARLYGLTIGNSIVAVYYGFVDRGRAYAYLKGYDPAFAKQSPGLLVLAHAIEEAVREGAKEFHFLRGDEAYKYEWGASRRCNSFTKFVRETVLAS